MPAQSAESWRAMEAEVERLRAALEKEVGMLRGAWENFESDSSSQAELIEDSIKHLEGLCRPVALSPKPCAHKAGIGNNCADCGADLDERCEPSDLPPKPDEGKL